VTAAHISPEAARALVVEVFVAAGMPQDLAEPAARVLVEAERDGLASHGWPACRSTRPDAHRQSRGHRAAAVERDGAVIRVDAGHGLAFAAIEASAAAARDVVREQGMCRRLDRPFAPFRRGGAGGGALRPGGLIARHGEFARGHGALGRQEGALRHQPDRLRLRPRADGAADPLVIDLSLSRVARGKVMLAQKAEKPIPEGWALDAEGNPTTDAAAAMAGSMVPMGGAKGAALALMVEL
jgi:(2R)-3-sulfolactate dehydrogenase (NADP+)